MDASIHPAMIPAKQGKSVFHKYEAFIHCRLFLSLHEQYMTDPQKVEQPSTAEES